MDRALKLLIAAACIVALAAGGYFVWTKWQAHQAEVAYRQSLDDSRDWLFHALRLEPGDAEGVRSSCRTIHDRPDIISDIAFREQVLTTCRALNFL